MTYIVILFTIMPKMAHIRAKVPPTRALGSSIKEINTVRFELLILLVILAHFTFTKILRTLI